MLEGILKQQCLDEAGLYIWVKKTFVLNGAEQQLEVIASEQNDCCDTKISLVGANYAKEWSFASTLSGFGFDIVWSSGQIWSFLVDDEESCKKWVNGLNQSISEARSVESSPVIKQIPTDNGDYQIDQKHPFESSMNETKLDSIPPNYLDPFHPDTVELQPSQRHFTQPPTAPNTSEYWLNNQNSSTISRIQKPTSSESEVESGSILFSAGYSSAEDSAGNHKGKKGNISFKPRQDNKGSPGRTLKSDSGERNFKLIKAMEKATNAAKNSADIATAELRNSQERNNILEKHYESQTMEIESLKEQLYHTQQQLLRLQEHSEQYYKRDGELQRVQEELLRAQEQLEARRRLFEKQLSEERAKTSEFISSARDEMERRVLRASNEHSGFFEASREALKAQHKRELECLREELAEERKRYTDVLEVNTITQNKKEKREIELKNQVNHLQDKITNLQIELAKNNENMKNQEGIWVREKKRIIAEYEYQIEQIKKENEFLTEKSESLSHKKMVELQRNYEQNLDTVRMNEIESLRQELLTEKVKALTEMQHKCHKDIEKVRVEERKFAAKEMENLRLSYLEREEQTSQDLLQLEELHKTRIVKLEKNIENMQISYRLLQEKFNQISKDLEGETRNAKNQQYLNETQREQYVQEAKRLHEELKNAHLAVQQAKSKESSYRDQLNKTLTELHVNRSELEEVKKQKSVVTTQVKDYKNATENSEKATKSFKTSLEIAKEEILMLENELKRKNEEIQHLRSDLFRADRLIYGVSQHEIDGKNKNIYKDEFEQYCCECQCGRVISLSSTLNTINTLKNENMDKNVISVKIPEVVTEKVVNRWNSLRNSKNPDAIIVNRVVNDGGKNDKKPSKVGVKNKMKNIPGKVLQRKAPTFSKSNRF